MSQKTSKAFLCSAVLHVLVLLLLIVSIEKQSQMPVVQNSDKDTKIISAMIMDSATPAPAAPPVVASVAPSKPEPKPEPKKVEISKPVPPKPQPEKAPVEKAIPVAQKPVPIKPVDDLQKKLALEMQQKAEAIQQKEKAIALEKARKKLMEAQKAEMEKQLLADIKKQSAKEKKQKQNALEQAMAKELKEQASQALQKQMRQAEQQAAGAKVQGIVNKYKALILQAISERWLVPPGIDKKLYTELLIRVAPGGSVLDVQVTRSSGVTALDRSARDAVFKASPLPVPDEADAFDQFRQFALKVKPENVLNNG